MHEKPFRSEFRWLGGALLALSLCSGCNDDGPVQPMRSMRQTPLPSLAPRALAATGKSGVAEPPPAPTAATLARAAAPAASHDQPGLEGQVRAPATRGSAKSTPAGNERFAVKRLVLTRGIQNKEPLPTSSFSPDGSPVYAFVELSNPGTVDAEIEIVFEHESGRRVGFVKLDVPAEHERWRTWGHTRQIRESGRWVAVVRTGDGRELMRQPFAVGTG